MIIEGGKNFEARKSGWYYDPTKASQGDWTRGSLYWIIDTKESFQQEKALKIVMEPFVIFQEILNYKN